MAGIKLSVLFLATAIFAVYAQDERHGGGRPTQNRLSLYPRLPVSPLFRPALPFRNPWLTPIRNPVLPFRPIVPTYGLPGFRPIYAGNVATPIQPINRPPATVPVQPIIPSNPSTSDNLVVPPVIPGNQEILQNPSELPDDPISDNLFIPGGINDEQVQEEPIDPVSDNLFFPGGANGDQVVEEPTNPHWPEEELTENLFFPDDFDLENEISSRKRRDLDYYGNYNSYSRPGNYYNRPYGYNNYGYNHNKYPYNRPPYNSKPTIDPTKPQISPPYISPNQPEEPEWEWIDPTQPQISPPHFPDETFESQNPISRNPDLNSPHEPQNFIDQSRTDINDIGSRGRRDIEDIESQINGIVQGATNSVEDDYNRARNFLTNRGDVNREIQNGKNAEELNSCIAEAQTKIERQARENRDRSQSCINGSASMLTREITQYKEEINTIENGRMQQLENQANQLNACQPQNSRCSQNQVGNINENVNGMANEVNRRVQQARSAQKELLTELAGCRNNQDQVFRALRVEADSLVNECIRNTPNAHQEPNRKV